MSGLVVTPVKDTDQLVVVLSDEGNDSLVLSGTKSTIYDLDSTGSGAVDSVAGLVGVISGPNLKSALAISSGDVSGLGSFATISSLASTGLSDKTTAGTNMFTAANVATQTALLNAVAGDSGAGGTKGMVPAPAAGDAGARKYLKASGGWAALAAVAETGALADLSGTIAKVTAAHGASFLMEIDEDLVTLSGATTNANIQIPAGSVVFGCSSLVITNITGGTLTSWEIGYTGSAGAFGSTLGLTAGSSNVGNIGGQGFYSPTNIVFTPNAGSFTGGQVRISLCYLKLTVPTS
jgi:hypothetical protein